MGLSRDEQNDVVIAALLHDIGALSLNDKLALLQFDFANPNAHAEVGYRLLNNFQPFSKIAVLVRYHHFFWENGTGDVSKGSPVPLGSHLLHLADRVSILINDGQEILCQVKNILDKVEERSGKMFDPQIFSAFAGLSDKEFFWFEAASPERAEIIREKAGLGTARVDMKNLIDMSSLFRRIIDFRSRFTANHSNGVAAAAEAIAGLSGFSEEECLMMRVAGYLHDLGKLPVPAEILEKPAKLNADELFIIKRHPFLTFRTLEHIGDFSTINNWAASHHEQLNGSGYPFHVKGPDISLGSRIMAVADVFTAICEDRPYRKGMDSEEVKAVLQSKADASWLDTGVVALLESHFDDINLVRSAARAVSAEEYRKFLLV